MTKWMLCLAVVAALCVGGAAQASWLTEITSPVLQFVGDTVTAPDTTGVVLGEPFTVAFQRTWQVGDLAGIKALDLSGGITVATEPPSLGGISTFKVTSIKGMQLCVGMKTAPAEDARWVVDVPGVFRIGLEPVIAIQRAW